MNVCGAKVHRIHPINVKQHQLVVDHQIKPTYLACEYACRLLSSKPTIVNALYSHLVPRANLTLALTLCPNPKPNPNPYSKHCPNPKPA